jgi:hypothetical protein
MHQAEAFGQRRDKEKLAGSSSPEDRKRDSAWGLMDGCLEIRVVHLAKPTGATEEGEKEAGNKERGGRGGNRQRASRSVVLLRNRRKGGCGCGGGDGELYCMAGSCTIRDKRRERQGKGRELLTTGGTTHQDGRDVVGMSCASMMSLKHLRPRNCAEAGD